MDRKRRQRNVPLNQRGSRFLFHLQQLMNFSSVLGLLYLIALVLIYLLIVVLWKVGTRGDELTFTADKVNYTLFVLMLVSIIGMLYCTYRGSDVNFVKRCTDLDLGCNWYLMIGVYTFGSGTLLRTTQSLFSYAYCDEGKSHTVFHTFQFIFITVQILFIQQFSMATFKRKPLLVLLLYHIMSSNLCLWISDILAETSIFSGSENPHQNCSNKSNVSKTAETWDTYTAAFSVEFSIIATGILAGIKNQTYLFNAVTDPGSPVKYSKKTLSPFFRMLSTLNKARSARVTTLKPGFLTGLLLSIILFVSSLSVSQNNDENDKIAGFVFHCLFTMLIHVCQTIIFWTMLQTLRNYRWAWHPLTAEDYLLIISGFGVFVLRVLSLIAEIDQLKTTSIDDIRAPVALIGNLYHGLLTLFQLIVLISSRRYKFSEIPNFAQERQGYSKLLFDSILFLMITCLGLWASCSFFEIRSDKFYPCLLKLLGENGNIFVGLLYPFSIFFYFHSAIILLDIWQAFHDQKIEEEKSYCPRRKWSVP